MAAFFLAALLLTIGLSPVSALAAGNTLRIAIPATAPAGTGATYTVTVTQDAAVPVSGAQVSLRFNPLALQVTSVRRGAAYEKAPIFLGASAEAIKVANTVGSLGAVAAAFIPPETVPAGSVDFLIIDFRVVGCGRSDLGLAEGATGSALLDGRAASYGATLAVTGSPASIVVIPCTPSESPVRTQAPTSGAGASASSATAAFGSCPIWLQTRANSVVRAILDAARPSFESAWAPQTTMLVGARATTDALSEVMNGSAQVAVIDRPLYPEEVQGLDAWKTGSDATGHPIFVAVRKPSIANRIDNSVLVRGDDFVNFMLSSPGQAAVAQAGYQPVGVPAAPPILDYDITLDGAVGLADIGNISARWSEASTCGGWIRADVDNNGAVGLSDIGQVTGRWGQTGFVAPNSPTPWADAITAHYEPHPGGLDTRQAGINMAAELQAAGYPAWNAYDTTAATAMGSGTAFGDAVWAMFGHGGQGGISTDDPNHDWTWVFADSTFGSCATPNACLTTAGWANLHRVRLMLFAGCDTALVRQDGVSLLTVARNTVGVDAAVGFSQEISWPPGDLWSQQFFHYLGPYQWDVGDSAWGAAWDTWEEYGSIGGWDSYVILGDDVWIMPPQYGQ